MIRVKFFNMPDNTWVLEDRNCIKLYADCEYSIKPKQVISIYISHLRYLFEGAVGIPFIPKGANKLTLYHPEGLNRWHNQNNAKVVVTNLSDTNIDIKKGDFICYIKLMSIQYYNLMKKHNNSDRGLASSKVKIELIDEQL